MALAPNLARRQAMIHDVYPTITIYGIGDTAHQAEASDHNPDARGIWHAIDIMTLTDAAHAGAAAHILAWLLSDVTDLQYVIHDRIIYGRDEANGWHGSPYTGSDPHTNHIHVSGKHGTTGRDAATGTGYDTAAEAMTPPPLEDDMTTADDILGARVDNIAPPAAGAPVTLAQAIRMMYYRTDYLGNTFAPAALAALKTITPAALGAAIVAALPPSTVGGLTEEQVGHAVHEQLVAQAQAAASAPEALTT